MEHLVRLGLNRNEAKALDALISLGPAGAADVHRRAGIPRNKAYESLEGLVTRGLVEVQQGRPALYRAIGANVIVNHLLDEYQRQAKEVLGLLERREESQKEQTEEHASAWMVRGERGVRRRLAELIFGAKSDVFSISGYPAKYVLSARTALKAAAKRGVTVRPVCMIRPTVDYEITADDAPSVVEYRTIKTLASLMSKPIDKYDDKLIEGFSHMSGLGAMVIIDEELAYDIIDDGRDPDKAVGIVIKAPGVPRIQKATAARILGLYTRRV